jgi:DNA-binding transcriptional MerR regulator
MSRTWRIGEVAERTGLTRRTLRHYDELGLLIPSERSWGDYRLYDGSDLLRLLQIQNLKALGLSLSEIAEALADPDLDAAATLRSHLAHLQDRIASEQALANRLRVLADASERTWEDVLAAIELTQRLSHPDPIVRLRAALQPTTPTAELLAALATESEPGVRDTLVWALAQQPDAAAVARAHLADADPLLRAAMVRVLGKLRDPAAAAALRERLDDPQPVVVTAAVQALGQLADPASAPALAGLLGTGTSTAHLMDALTAIGAPALEPLSLALGSPSAEVRSAAAEAIGRIGGGSSTELGAQCSAILAPLLADPDHAVRLSALVALGDLGAAGRPAIEAALAGPLLADPALAGVARRLLDLPVT